MGSTLRKSMAWLHTWAGVVIGSLLFAIFWMGSLSVFDREIDRWMQPATRLPAPTQALALDPVITPRAQALATGAAQWSLALPDERTPVVSLRWHGADGRFVTRALDPRSGEPLPDQGSHAGTGFIFPFHYSLHLKWLDLGYWLVGLAGMSMLALIVSGVIIHRRIFIDFFLFRPRRQLQRASLDLHNLTGVLALPFHFVITLSGLIIFIGVYFPQAHVGAYGEGKQARASYQAEAFGRYTRPKSGRPGTLASLDAMQDAAEQHWAGGKAYFIRVWHPGDANSYVEMRRGYKHDVTMNLDQVFFDAQTGAVLHRFEAAPVMTVQRFISGMHFIQFEHWGLRWLYFAGGLAGCVMIATGFLFWLEARRASHARKGLAGVRVVEALTVASVSGIVIATLAFFVANRLLPLGAQWLGQGRAALEMWAFYLAWLTTLAHAAWRRADPATQPARRAWREQCLVIAVLAGVAVALNGITTGDHLAATLARGRWAVAGMDLLLLAGGAAAAFTALRLRQRREAVSPRLPPPLGAGAGRQEASNA
jgi:uncharacterized iron-regulated membrane protein